VDNDVESVWIKARGRGARYEVSTMNKYCGSRPKAEAQLGEVWTILWINSARPEAADWLRLAAVRQR
jgi:hypothetical protein